MKRAIKAGAVDQTIDIFIQDSSSATGAGLTGLAYNTASLVCYYRKAATGSATALTLATQTVGGAHSDGGFVEISSANMPGMYRLDLSDTIVGTAGLVSMMLKGAANMAPLPIELQVVSYNPEDSVRLGLTALPNAAADAAGGLPISDAGGLDLDAQNTSVAAILVDTGTDIPAQISGIGNAGGAAVNVDATTDNYGGGISGVTSGTTKVGTQTNTYTATSFDNGTYHVMTHAGNAIDIVYQFLVGGGSTPISAHFNGYLASGNDTVTVSAWNHAGGAWEAIGTIAGQSGSVDITQVFVLYARHKGTSAAESGKVYIRLHCTGMTLPVLNTDQLYVSYAVTSRTVGYANGAVWIDTNTGVAGTESFVNGVADNPVSTQSDAVTIAAAIGLRNFEIANGSSITLAASAANKVFNGHEWTLALGGQNIAEAMFIDATVSGTGTGSAAEFDTCEMGAVTLAPCFLWDCSLASTFTVGSAGDFFFYNCHSAVAGTSTPTIDMGAAVGATNLSFRRWSGGLTFTNIAAGDVISIDVISGGTITLGGADGNCQIRGMCNIVDNRTGSPTLGRDNNMDYRFDNLDAAITVIDDFLDTEVAAIKAKTDNLPSDPADASDVAGAFSTVNTTLSTIAGYLDTEIAAIKAKTDNLPSDPADQSAVEAAIIAATSPLATAASLDVVDNFLDTEIAAIKAKTDSLTFTTANRVDAQLFGAEANTLTASALATDAVTEIQSGLATAAALTTIDDFLDTEIAAIKAVTDQFAFGTANRVNAQVYGIEANAITASALATDAGAEIADAVWDEVISGHATAGTTGAALSSAGSAGDPWTTALPGAYASGTAGYKLGNLTTTGAGATSWTYTVTNSSGGAGIADVDVWVTSDLAGTTVIASGRTNSSGAITFYLDSGATVYVWCQKSGFNFTNPDTEVVS